MEPYIECPILIYILCFWELNLGPYLLPHRDTPGHKYSILYKNTHMLNSFSSQTPLENVNYLY